MNANFGALLTRTEWPKRREGVGTISDSSDVQKTLQMGDDYLHGYASSSVVVHAVISSGAEYSIVLMPNSFEHVAGESRLRDALHVTDDIGDDDVFFPFGPRVRCSFSLNNTQMEDEDQEPTENLIQLRDTYLRCWRRIRELSNLKNGWYNGTGRGPTQAAIEASRRFLDAYPKLAIEFSICPTERGGIVFEFELNGWDYSVELNSSGRVMLYGIEIEGDGEIRPRRFSDLGDDFFEKFNNYVGTWV